MSDVLADREPQMTFAKQDEAMKDDVIEALATNQIAIGTVPDCERQDEVDLCSAP